MTYRPAALGLASTNSFAILVAVAFMLSSLGMVLSLSKNGWRTAFTSSLLMTLPAGLESCAQPVVAIMMTAERIRKIFFIVCTVFGVFKGSPINFHRQKS